MNDKINIGEVTVAEFNVIMKQLAAGQLGECIDLFMKLSKLGQDFQAAQQNSIRLSPPAATDLNQG
jgi:hypothetical protein